MRPQGSSALAGLRVQRHFEGHRLAEDCQARAYEQAVPIVDRSESVAPMPNQADEDRVGTESVQAKGVAA
jgi:hypothetical protein